MEYLTLGTVSPGCNKMSAGRQLPQELHASVAYSLARSTTEMSSGPRS